MLIKTALKKLDRASELILEAKNNLNKTGALINGMDTPQNIKPLCKQGELFLPNTPVYDEKLSRLCLASLVETLTGLSDWQFPSRRGG